MHYRPVLVKIKIFVLTCQFTFCCYLLPRFLNRKLVWIIFAGTIVQTWVSFKQITQISYFLVDLQPSCSLSTGNWSLDNGLRSPRNWQLVYSMSWLEQLQTPCRLWLALPLPSSFLCMNKLIQPHLLCQRNSSFRCVVVEFTLADDFCMNAA